MVMRYWGATGIYAENFASLVDRDAGGIRGDDLIRSLQARGWEAVSRHGDVALIQRTLNERRPPIALIEDSPGRFHYVVIVGWHARGVVLHDPARAPFRILDETSFLRAWSRSSYWTLLALPPRDLAPAPRQPGTDEAAASASGGLCGEMVDQAIRLANGGSMDDAKELLELATLRCPQEPAGWRELAGVHAVRKEWAMAAADARRALALDSRDDHAAQTLATSLYLAGDRLAALDAWNIVGEPIIDLVDVRGLERTRFGVAANALRLTPKTRLTSDAMRRAARRLDALPSAIGARVSYTPREDGLARVEAFIIERPVFPTTTVAAASTLLRTMTDRDLRVDIASPTGGGELWHAAWRWWEPRRRLSFGVDAPAPFGGTWSVAAADEHETFGTPGVSFAEHRRTATIQVRDWLTGNLGWEVGIGLDRWSTGRTAAISGGLQSRRLGDRALIRGRLAGWLGAERVWTASWSADWRSTIVNDGVVWSAGVGADVASDAAPLMLWSGAGTGQGRSALLRGHPLLDDGVIRQGVFGRRLLYGTAEWRRWGKPIAHVLRLAPAMFADVARAYRVPSFADRRAHVDVGVGLRVAIPGSGVLRADVARGLRDGATAVSFGWTR